MLNKGCCHLLGSKNADSSEQSSNKKNAVVSSAALTLKTKIVHTMNIECFVCPFYWYLKSDFALGFFLTNIIYLIN